MHPSQHELEGTDQRKGAVVVDVSRIVSFRVADRLDYRDGALEARQAGVVANPLAAARAPVNQPLVPEII